MATPRRDALRMDADAFLSWTDRLGEDADFELVCGSVAPKPAMRVRESLARTELAGQIIPQLASRAYDLFISGLLVRIGDASLFSRALLYRHGRTAAEPEVIEGDAPTTIEIALPQGKLTLDLAKVFAAAA